MPVEEETIDLPDDIVFILGRGGRRKVKGGGKCWGACLNKRRGGGGAKKTGAIGRALEKARHPEGKITRGERKQFKKIDSGKQQGANFKGAAAKYNKYREEQRRSGK